MKAEINDLTHAQFIAQYYGQPCVLNGEVLFELHAEDFGTIVRSNTPLPLRSISSLTDEEKVKCYHLYSAAIAYDYTQDFSSVINHANDCWSTDRELMINTTSVSDYLRSIGILLPYRGIPEEEIIAAGWAVIRKEETA